MPNQYKNGIFLITEENQCPLYNVGEEFSIQEGILNLPAAKPTCLILARELINITAPDTVYEHYRSGTDDKMKFECGGCVGIIRFEFKKEKGYSTLQMKLLAASERKEKIKKSSEFASMLRKVEIFKPLTSDDLLDLSILLELRQYPWQFPITQKGDPDGRFCVIISGKAEVIDEHGITLVTLHEGDVFGEMSLLSGERVTSTVVAAEPCEIAEMSQKNFKHILKRFPVLHIFFYKLMVSRITAINDQRTEELSSGMVGQLSDIGPIELCQLINSSQKTGKLQIDYQDRRAIAIFNEGELVDIQFGALSGKKAFYAMIALGNGRFKFSQGLTSAEKKMDVVGGFMGMLLEGMKRIDDSAA